MEGGEEEQSFKELLMDAAKEDLDFLKASLSNVQHALEMERKESGE